MPKTNNMIERYFRNTHPEKVKKRFKTKEGLLAHLKRMGERNNVGFVSIFGVFWGVLRFFAYFMGR